MVQMISQSVASQTSALETPTVLVVHYKASDRHCRATASTCSLSCKAANSSRPETLPFLHNAGPRTGLSKGVVNEWRDVEYRLKMAVPGPLQDKLGGICLDFPGQRELQALTPLFPLGKPVSALEQSGWSPRMHFIFSDKVVLLFDFWSVHSPAGIALSALVVLLLAVLYEGIKVGKAKLLHQVLVSLPTSVSQQVIAGTDWDSAASDPPPVSRTHHSRKHMSMCNTGRS
ncbi:probable low affinity copper uptake protein 2 isoform X2 [Lemur catta]|uniref:probable low affinity copper uptake protein 2 isoform X2 n=1 Tax=Lemur catta TaxID=9447 RepID=UPI001E26E008|nr:probable low affinity copper uptake protein 2 isoform X2 [Lemur catta]